jgi:hypothetical protein
MCISFGNPSEPCCGGKGFSGAAQYSSLSDSPGVWSLGDDGFSSMRSLRGKDGDEHVRFRFTGRSASGRRLAELQYFVPQLPKRFLDLGFPNVVKALSVGFDFLEQRLPEFYPSRTGNGAIFAGSLPLIQNRKKPGNYQRSDEDARPVVSLTGESNLDIQALITAYHLRTKTVVFNFPGASVTSTTGDTLQIGSAFRSKMQRIGSDSLFVFCNATFVPNPAAWDAGTPQYEQLQKIVSPFVTAVGFVVRFDTNPDFDPAKQVTAKNYPVVISATYDSERQSFESGLIVQSWTNTPGNASSGQINFSTGLSVSFRIIHSAESISQGRLIARGLKS